MRVLHIICGIARSSGGPSRSCQGLVAGLRAAGVDAWLMTLSHGEEPWIEGVDKFINGGDFGQALDHVRPEIVHIHGIWAPALHRCVVLCRARQIPYVVAPRGMLEPWSLKQKWLKKKLARLLYQDRDLRLAAALHATAESEAEQFRKLGFRNDCIVSPNGVNVPQSMPARDNEDGVRRALFVSRMHVKKGVLELVESWSRVRPEGWVCELVYTLNGDEERKYEAQVKHRVKDLGLDGAFVFTGPLGDDEKWEAYSRADLFVLPTYSENFGIVVAEALWAGVPVITTKGTPWSDLVSNNCGWWIDTGVDALVEALKDAFIRVERGEHVEMGKRGRELIEHKYTWDAVVGAMKQGYEQILNSHQHVSSGHCSCV